jgi:DNA-binding LytR/AlgR family response regulator
MENFKVIIVEDVPLELKGTQGIIRNDIPEAEIIGTADNEQSYWRLLKQQVPDLVLLDLGLGGSTTVGVELCRHTKESHPEVKVLISYADTTAGNKGTIYKAANYELVDRLKADFYQLPSGERIHPVSMWHRPKTRAWDFLQKQYPGIIHIRDGEQLKFVKYL